MTEDDEGRKFRHKLTNLAAQVIGYTDLAMRHFGPEAPEGPGVLPDLQKAHVAATGIISLLGGESIDTAANAETLVRPTPAPEPASVSGSSSLLIVDDEAAIREIFRRRFAEEGYRIHEAASGAEAQRVLESEAIDAMLLDVSMPDVNGFQTLRAVREGRSRAELPIIMVTAMGRPDDIVGALDGGANDYVHKTMDIRVISARVRTQIALKRANDTIRALNDELRVAQEKIARMADSGGQAMQNIPAWAVGVAKDLAPAVRAADMSVWCIDNDAVVSIAETTAIPPTLADLQEAQKSKRFFIDGDRTVVAVAGMTGRLGGGLVVHGKSSWTDSERQLVATFAFQLGGALELKQVRSELEAARAREAAAQKAIRSEGLRVVGVCRRCTRCYDESVERCPVDGGSLDLRPVPLIIDDKYRLVRRLGKGGMGEVFHARDLRLTRDVALKVITPEQTSPILRRQFEQEARALASIDSDYVVRIHEYGELPGPSAYLVTELLDGIDLRGVLDRCGRGTPSQVAHLMRQASSGLRTAHAARLIHRDIKPANLFLLDDGSSFSVKVIDFGIVKRTSEGSLTLAGILMGTPPYMSPEQLASAPLTHRSDIYSFATTIWEALVGRRLVVANEGVPLLVEIALSEPRRLSMMIPDIPRDIDQAFVAALNRDPQQRPADIEEWAHATAKKLERLPDPGAGWPRPLPRVVPPDGAPTVPGGTMADADVDAAAETDVMEPTSLEKARTVTVIRE